MGVIIHHSGTKLGRARADAFRTEEGRVGDSLIGMRGGRVPATPYADAVGRFKAIDPAFFDLARMLELWAPPVSVGAAYYGRPDRPAPRQSAAAAGHGHRDRLSPRARHDPGGSLGVAAILFAGLAIGALSPDLKLPEVVYQLGLILFVYTVGLRNGRAFVASFRRRGLRNIPLVLGVLLPAAALAAGARAARPLAGARRRDVRRQPHQYAGIGGRPTIPARVRRRRGPRPAPRRAGRGLLGDLPAGRRGHAGRDHPRHRWWGVDYAAEARRTRDREGGARRLQARTIRVIRPAAAADTLGALRERWRWEVVFGRLKHAGRLCLAGRETRLAIGDLVTAVGEWDALDAVTAALGEASGEHLELDHRDLDFRRIFISSPQVAGRALGELHLTDRFGAVATRIRRGDVELLPRDDTVLEPSDRVGVVRTGRTSARSAPTSATRIAP